LCDLGRARQPVEHFGQRAADLAAGIMDYARGPGAVGGALKGVRADAEAVGCTPVRSSHATARRINRHGADRRRADHSACSLQRGRQPSAAACTRTRQAHREPPSATPTQAATSTCALHATGRMQPGRQRSAAERTRMREGGGAREGEGRIEPYSACQPADLPPCRARACNVLRCTVRDTACTRCNTAQCMQHAQHDVAKWHAACSTQTCDMRHRTPRPAA
jgi:hypothetical protein